MKKDKLKETKKLKKLLNNKNQNKIKLKKKHY